MAQRQKKQLTWGSVFFREYARSVHGGAAIPEDNQYSFCLGMSDKIVMRDPATGEVAGAIAIFTGSGDIVPVYTANGDVIMSPLPSTAMASPPPAAGGSDVSANNTGYDAQQQTASPLESTAAALAANDLSAASVDAVADDSLSAENSQSESTTASTVTAEEVPGSEQSLASDTSAPGTGAAGRLAEHGGSGHDGIAASTMIGVSVFPAASPPPAASKHHGAAASEDEGLSTPGPSGSGGDSGAAGGALASSAGSNSVESASAALASPSSAPSLTLPMPANPPPRTLLPGEVYAGTVDSYDSAFQSFKASREAARLGSLKRRRPGQGGPAAAAQAPSWFSLNAKQRQARMMSEVLADPPAEISAINAATTLELKNIVENRRKSNVGCRCSLLEQEELMPLPVKDLKSECALRGIPSDGTKKVLVQRLVEHSKAHLGCTRNKILPQLVFIDNIRSGRSVAEAKAAAKKCEADITSAASNESKIAAVSFGASSAVSGDGGGGSSIFQRAEGSDGGAAAGVPTVANAAGPAAAAAEPACKRARGADDADVASSSAAVGSGADRVPADGEVAASSSTAATAETAAVSTPDSADASSDSTDSDSSEDSIPGDTKVRLQKAHYSALMLSMRLKQEEDEAAAGNGDGSGASLSSSARSASPSSSSSSASSSSSSIGPVPGTRIPALDVCPCAANGLGCHFSTCACDVEFCCNRNMGDPSAAQYDDTGIFLHRSLVRMMQAGCPGAYFYDPALVSEWRSKQLEHMAREIAASESAGGGSSDGRAVSISFSASGVPTAVPAASSSTAGSNAAASSRQSAEAMILEVAAQNDEGGHENSDGDESMFDDRSLAYGASAASPAPAASTAANSRSSASQRGQPSSAGSGVGAAALIASSSSSESDSFAHEAAQRLMSAIQTSEGQDVGGRQGHAAYLSSAAAASPTHDLAHALHQHHAHHAGHALLHSHHPHPHGQAAVEDTHDGVRSVQSSDAADGAQSGGAYAEGDGAGSGGVDDDDMGADASPPAAGTGITGLGSYLSILGGGSAAAARSSPVSTAAGADVDVPRRPAQ